MLTCSTGTSSSVMWGIVERKGKGPIKQSPIKKIKKEEDALLDEAEKFTMGESRGPMIRPKGAH